MKKLLFLITILLLIPGFLGAISLVPTILLVNNFNFGSSLSMAFALPFVLFFWIWPTLIASFDSMFFIYIFILPLLLVITVYLIIRMNIKTKWKIIYFCFLLFGMLAYILQFYSSSKIFMEYKPAFAMYPKVSYDWVTKPNDIEALRKNYLASTDAGKGDQAYIIIGWKNNEQLIYTKGVLTYEYDIKDKKTKLYSNNSNPIHKSICILDECLKEQVEYAGLINDWKAKVFKSPDEEKYAVVSEYMYGPQDVLVIYK